MFFLFYSFRFFLSKKARVTTNRALIATEATITAIIDPYKFSSVEAAFLVSVGELVVSCVGFGLVVDGGGYGGSVGVGMGVGVGGGGVGVGKVMVSVGYSEFPLTLIAPVST